MSFPSSSKSFSSSATFFLKRIPAAGVRFKKNVALLEKDFKELGKLIG